LVQYAKKSISDRADKERMVEFRRAKKHWRNAAISMAIADGDIEDSSLISTGNDEEEDEELIDGLYYIDNIVRSV
jgi:hypothetical protein